MTTHFSRQAMLAVALAGLATTAAAAPAATDPMVQCFGVSKAGQNDCASSDGVHSCAGQSKVDDSKADFKSMPKGTCEKLGGKASA